MKKKALLFMALMSCFLCQNILAQSSTDITRKAKIIRDYKLDQKPFNDEFNKDLNIDTSSVKCDSHIDLRLLQLTNKSSKSDSVQIQRLKNEIALLYSQNYEVKYNLFLKKEKELTVSVENITSRADSFSTLLTINKIKEDSLNKKIQACKKLLGESKVYNESINKNIIIYGLKIPLKENKGEKFDMSDSTLRADMDSMGKTIDGLRKKSWAKIKEANSNLKTVKTRIDKVIDERNKIESKVNPSFLSNVITPRIVPAINLLATKTYVNNGAGSAFTINVFAAPTVDTIYLKEKSNFLIPEASNFGIGGHIVKNFNEVNSDASMIKDQFALSSHIYYLNKKLPQIDTADNSIKKTNTVGLLHLKFGGQYTYKNFCSFYINYNLFSALAGRTYYKEYFKTNMDITGFLDTGVKTDLYIVSNSDDHHVLLDLNFIINNANINNTMNLQDDFILPVLRISYIKNL